MKINLPQEVLDWKEVVYLYLGDMELAYAPDTEMRYSCQLRCLRAGVKALFYQVSQSPSNNSARSWSGFLQNILFDSEADMMRADHLGT